MVTVMVMIGDHLLASSAFAAANKGSDGSCGLLCVGGGGELFPSHPPAITLIFILPPLPSAPPSSHQLGM